MSRRGPRQIRHHYGRTFKRNITYAGARKIETLRSKKARETDLRLNALTRYPAGEKDYSKWVRDPARSDVVGIDTLRGQKKIPQRREVQRKELPLQRPEVISRKEFESRQKHITPFVKGEYRIWHEQYLKDKQEGRVRKNLTEPGLQKYYDSREAAFEAEGGSPDGFKDAFDKVDIAVASDSWHDLDGELKRQNIYGPDVSEMHRKARDEAREDRRISTQYEEYLKAEGEKHAAAG